MTSLVYLAVCGLNRTELRREMRATSEMVNNWFAKIHSLPDVEQHLLFMDAIMFHLEEVLDGQEQEKGEEDG